jgi:hypothetical protein
MLYLNLYWGAVIFIWVNNFPINYTVGCIIGLQFAEEAGNPQSADFADGELAKPQVK